MRRLNCVLLSLLGGTFSAASYADEAVQLLQAINQYRSQIHSCAGAGQGDLPALVMDNRLVLPVGVSGDLQQALAEKGYPLTNAQAINLSGPYEAQAAFKVLEQSYCQILLDVQFVDIGVSQWGRDWRIVLARPLLKTGLGDGPQAGNQLLEAINQARSEPRSCGSESFTAAAPLRWSPLLAQAAEQHSRDMANNNYFSHKDKQGYTPGDRAELAGYLAGSLAENIAAAQDDVHKVLASWLASPGHCANVMSPRYSELGASYAVDPKSDAGIYWTALFGSP